MFAKFDENPAKTHQNIKETKRYGRTHTRTQLYQSLWKNTLVYEGMNDFKMYVRSGISCNMPSRILSCQKHTELRVKILINAVMSNRAYK